MLMKSLEVLPFLKKVVSVLWFFPSSSYFSFSVNQVRKGLRITQKTLPVTSRVSGTESGVAHPPEKSSEALAGAYWFS